MSKAKKNTKPISELRQDVVSHDWVVIATGRAKRPHDFIKQKRLKFVQPRRNCPFEKLHSDALIAFSLDGVRGRENWQVEVIPNKYPAFGRGMCKFSHYVGPYQWAEGVGFHEVVVSRDHLRSFGEMSDEEAELMIRAYQERYMALEKETCIKYISIFHNHGRLAGATMSHPHSQIIAIPVIPPDVKRSVEGSLRYFYAHRVCVHCMVLRYERKVKVRVVYENDLFLAIAPYATKTAFEIRIFPKKHRAHFEDMDLKERMAFAHTLRVALGKLYQGLRNPDYNFFLHTAPIGERKEFHNYHWHMEILPKTAIWAGFEIGTGIEIATIAPETAAAFLRKIKV